MSEKTYLYLLIFCGILCQEIIATLLSNKNTSESSDFLVRKRRVISHCPGGSTAIKIEHANYNVILKENNRAHCSGVILSHHTVITAEPCVKLSVGEYSVFSGSVYDKGSQIHRVASKAIHFGKAPYKLFDGIALITVDPPFVFGARIGNIHLYAGILSAGTHVSVTGWGFSYPRQPGPTVRRALRRITLPLINLGECQGIYRYQYNITDKNLCTNDERQYCARTDAGAPLIVNNMLAGIHVYKGEFPGQINPDVYINLHHADYSQWIRERIL